uniref:Uncharacterized protein n=1 Tax=Eutreptiella gymnastica TaxID=73025 RepID=A0A6T2BRE8_9EUGL
MDRRMAFLFTLLLMATTLPSTNAQTTDAIGICRTAAEPSCHCGTCTWLYQRQSVCEYQTLEHCVTGGYYDNGSNEGDCCKPHIFRIIMITVIVTVVLAAWCCLIACIIKLKRVQKKKRQNEAVGAVDVSLLPTADSGTAYDPQNAYATYDPEQGPGAYTSTYEPGYDGQTHDPSAYATDTSHYGDQSRMSGLRRDDQYDDQEQRPTTDNFAGVTKVSAGHSGEYDGGSMNPYPT